MKKSQRYEKPSAQAEREIINLSARGGGKTKLLLSYACGIAQNGHRVHFHTATDIGKQLTEEDVYKVMGRRVWPIGLRVLGPEERERLNGGKAKCK